MISTKQRGRGSGRTSTFEGGTGAVREHERLTGAETQGSQKRVLNGRGSGSGGNQRTGTGALSESRNATERQQTEENETTECEKLRTERMDDKQRERGAKSAERHA